MNNKYELIKFEDGEFSLDVSVDPSEDTVWLTKEQMGLLFDRNRTTISKHIKEIYEQSEVSRTSSCVKNAHQIKGQIHYTEYYNLDVIISVGYRVHSKRGILFRKWATSVLKQYMMQGYAINEKRCIECSSNIISLQNKVNKLENDIKDIYFKV